MLNRHREVTGHAFAYLVQHLRGMPVGEALILDHHMRGQGGQASGDRRCVQVVHVGDVFELKDVPAYLVQVEPGRGELHEHPGGVAHQNDRARHDQSRDQEPCNRVGLLEPGRGDHNRGHDHPERAECIVDHLQERCPHIEVRAAARGEDHDRDHIRREADDAEHEHLSRGDLRRLEQASDTFDGGVSAHHQQQCGLPECGDHLDASESPGPLRISRPQHQRRRDQRDQQTGRVGDRVCGVRQQRQAAGDDGTDRLRDHDRRRQAERDPQSCSVIPGRSCLGSRCTVVVTRTHVPLLTWSVTNFLDR